MTDKIKEEKKRCEWSFATEKMIAYHDTEWGVPVYDDLLLFEHFILDAFQAGLTWSLILNKRDNFRKAFSGFNPEKVAKYNEIKIFELTEDTGIIRNKLKINAAVTNAQAFLKVQEDFDGFYKYIWQFSDHKTKKNKWRAMAEIPATSIESDNMSKDLKKRGFKFCGSTICYAFMQATGMINDHIVSCFRYKEIEEINKKIKPFH